MDEYTGNAEDVFKHALMPLSAFGADDYATNPSEGFWGLVSAAGAGAGAYHGYKRNEADNPVAWALWWGLWGAVIPIVTVPIALAQGFAEPAAPPT